MADEKSKAEKRVPPQPREKVWVCDLIHPKRLKQSIALFTTEEAAERWGEEQCRNTWPTWITYKMKINRTSTLAEEDYCHQCGAKYDLYYHECKDCFEETSAADERFLVQLQTAQKKAQRYLRACKHMHKEWRMLLDGSFSLADELHELVTERDELKARESAWRGLVQAARRQFVDPPEILKKEGADTGPLGGTLSDLAADIREAGNYDTQCATQEIDKRKLFSWAEQLDALDKVARQCVRLVETVQNDPPCPKCGREPRCYMQPYECACGGWDSRVGYLRHCRAALTKQMERYR